MAQENIRVQQPNFCIAPLIGTFASVDTTNALAQLLVKNSSGDTTVSYTFNPNIAQDTEIHYLEYIGARNQISLESGMVFLTMESNGSSSVSIKKWNLDKGNTRLNLDYTINKSTDANDTIKCTNMAAGRYYTTLSNTTVTGTGSIKVDNIDNIVSGTRLYIGPSSNSSYLNAYEEVLATSVSGTTVFLDDTVSTPLHSYFNAGDPVTYMGDMYLLSDTGTTGKGALITIDNYTGTTLDRHYSALYSDVTSTNYGIPYYDTIAIVKHQELLYVRLSDYTIQRSVRLNVAKPQDAGNIIPVEALAFTLSSIFRLQEDKLIRDDDGNHISLSWSSFNYHEDNISRFVDSIAVEAMPIAMLANQETITIRAHVKDQYGMAVAGKIVHFDKEWGDSNGIWGDINRESVTDINGIADITYTSGWFDSMVIEDINEDIFVTAYTDGSNVLTGSIYVWTNMTLWLNAKYMLAPDTIPDPGVELIVQKDNIFESENSFRQIQSFDSEFTLKAYSFFEFPGGHDYHQSLNKVAVIQQWRTFESESSVQQEELSTSKFALIQEEQAQGDVPISQTYVSRHLPAGSNEDTVNIAQFRFIIDAIPVPFSEKNNVNANIWIKLAPYGFDLNKSTLVFKVREVSYAGDTGYINYENAANLQVVEYDAGGGLIGLELTYIPDEYFHNSAIVHVYLEVYDNGIPPNRIEFDYWFTVIPDYKAPYIINEIPYRGETDVPVNFNISFDIVDTEVGVDIASLELFVNNRIKIFTYEAIPNGYTVTFDSARDFYYEQTIEVSLRVEDTSGQSNVLYDMWRFYCEGSLAPIVDEESLFPNVCVKGYDTRTTLEIFNVYDGGGGLDKDSIELIVNGVIRPVNMVPVLKRIL